MSRDGSVTIVFGDDEHSFRLGIKHLREMQERCDAGPPFILERLRTNRWMIDDVREPIRLGLLGGGMSAEEAAKLVTRYVDGRPLSQSVPYATAILIVALYGAPDEPLEDSPGKTEAAEDSPSFHAESSPSPPSTEPAQPSA